MKNLAISLVFLLTLFVVSDVAQTNCLQDAKIVKPALSDATRKKFDKHLFRARMVFEKSPNDADAIIWFGRRTAYLGRYKDAIRIYSKGIAQRPKDARMYRHRGHRFITIRCFDDAIADFEKAAKLIKGKPDEIEPDGLPNSRDTPTSTLQSNIWYHLGLAHYLKGDFKNALEAYEECIKVSRNPDMLVATTNWLYVTLRRLGKTSKARKVLGPIKDDLDIIENDSYYKLLKVYQGKIEADDLLNEVRLGTDGLSNASVGYGLANWFFLIGDRKKALEVYRLIREANQWSSFGHIAMHYDIRRLEIR